MKSATRPEGEKWEKAAKEAQSLERLTMDYSLVDWIIIFFYFGGKLHASTAFSQTSRSRAQWKIHTILEKKQSFHRFCSDVFQSLACFHTSSPTFHVCHTWECWRHEANDHYDGGVYLPADVSENKRNGTGWVEWVQCRPLPWAQREPGRERERGRWGVGKRGWIVLCAGKEKRERLLWYVYMSVRPRSHWSNLSMLVYTLKSLASSFPNVNITIMPWVSTTIICCWT